MDAAIETSDNTSNTPLPNKPLPNAPLPNAPLPNAPLPNAPLPNNVRRAQFATANEPINILNAAANAHDNDTEENEVISEQPGNEPVQKKQKRTRLSLNEKEQIARMLQEGVKASQVMRQFGLSRRTVFNIKAQTASLVKKAEEASVALTNKSVRLSQLPEVDKQVLQFISIARMAKMPLTHAIIQQKALEARDILLQKERNRERQEKLSKFNASKGWVEGFVKRHAIRYVSLQADRSTPRTQDVSSELSDLRDKLRPYTADCIYHIEDTGLFYKLLPQGQYLPAQEGTNSLSNIRTMRLQSRVTAYLCANADGSRKLPVTIIGSVKTPKSFRLERPATPYLQQTNAWSDSTTFRTWFTDVFVPFAQKATSRPIALLIDSRGPHSRDLIDASGQVSVMTLPTTFSKYNQPLSDDVLTSWKTNYRSVLLNHYISNMDMRTQIRMEYENLPAGMLGIAEGYDPHMLDVTQMVQESWNAVSSGSIASAWVKADILPPVTNAKLVGSLEKSGRSRHSQGEQVGNLIATVRKLQMSAGQSGDCSLDTLVTDASRKNIEHWLRIEDDEHVINAMVNDALCSAGYQDVHDTARDGLPCSSDVQFQYSTQRFEDSEDDGTVGIMPSPSEVRSMFSALETIAFDCNIREGCMHLRQAKQALLAAAATVNVADQSAHGVNQ